MSTFNTGLTGDLSTSRLGKPNGFAELGADGRVLTEQLPAAQTGVPNADEVPYNNTTSGLASVNLQSAIDEVNEKYSSSQNKEEFNKEIIVDNKTLTVSDNVYQHINTDVASLVITLPFSPINGTHFIIKNSIDSTESFTINNVVVNPRELYEIKYDGVEWVEL